MHLLASGPGWRVKDVTCSAGPHDRPFEEQHDLVCVAAVTRGTFQYRTPNGRATLVPGALMLGNPGACFECGHKHGVGDRCLSFHPTFPGFWVVGGQDRPVGPPCNGKSRCARAGGVENRGLTCSEARKPTAPPASRRTSPLVAVASDPRPSCWRGRRPQPG